MAVEAMKTVADLQLTHALTDKPPAPIRLQLLPSIWSVSMASLHATTTALVLALLLSAQTAHGEDAAQQAEPAAVANSQRAPLTERSQAEALALQQQLPAGEQQQLSAGDEQFLALWA
jgi:hypothetical protein